jgi:hypothetical protein
MRFVCRIRSWTRLSRSRESRRPSSSSGLGGTTMAQTRGSPRFQAISVRRSVSPSIASVLARRWRRGAATDAGSTTWLSTPRPASSRCTQKPSKPASWMLTTSTAPRPRCSALALRRARSSSRAAPSPPATVCFDILPLPGDRDVTSQVEPLSSSGTKSLASSGGLATASWARWSVTTDIGRLHEGRLPAAITYQGRPPSPA